MRKLGWALAAMLWGTAPAQTTGTLPPGYSGVQSRVPGIFLTPVANAPFTGQVDIVSHHKLPDGTEQVTTARNTLARTSSGKVYQEYHFLAAPELLGKMPLMSRFTYDPSSRQRIDMFPQTHLARLVVLRGPQRLPADALPPAERPPDPGVTETDLGSQSMDGMELHGLRRQRIVPAELSGTGKPVTVTDDYWYSPALSIYMTIRHDDPRTGEQLVAVTNVKRVEPDAQQFAVPPDYKLVDETTPDAPVARDWPAH